MVTFSSRPPLASRQLSKAKARQLTAFSVRTTHAGASLPSHKGTGAGVGVGAGPLVALLPLVVVLMATSVPLIQIVVPLPWLPLVPLEALPVALGISELSTPLGALMFSVTLSVLLGGAISSQGCTSFACGSSASGGPWLGLASGSGLGIGLGLGLGLGRLVCPRLAHASG